MTLAVAFFAGLVSCVSPCVLPVLPVFVSYAAGDPGTTPLGALAATRRRGLGFLAGFLGVFVLLWASLGVVGFGLIGTVPAARQIVGLAIIAMGLAMVAGRMPEFRVPGRLANAGRGGPVLLGAGVAVGWTPCIGPTLGAIIGLAASAPTVGIGTLLLVAYAAGLAVPFLAVLLFIERWRRLARLFAAHGRALERLSGALIAGVGVLIFADAFARLASLFAFGAG